MEVAGLTLSAVAIATLFNTCVECFETFSHGKNLQKDFSYLMIRLDFEKTQMLLWGNSSGILKVENEGRHARLTDPTVCRLVEDALNAIQALLSDASVLRERYGVESAAATSAQSTSAHLLSSNSMSFFRTSWSRFCIRAARALPERGSHSTIARARWAIHDKAKFKELLETLSSLVEKLHLVVPVPDSQYEDLESDIAAILDISQLKLVETALKSSSNVRGKALSKAASVIISDSENGTVDRRTIVDWLRDTQWVEDSNESSAATTQGASRLNLKGKLSYLAANSNQSLFFVNTPECRNLTTSTPCLTITAANRLPNTYNNKYHTNSPQSLRSFFPNFGRPENWQPPETTVNWPFATIFVHTSPCQWAIQTAVDIATVLKNRRLDAVVRVDDRISSSCLHSTADRITVLQSILAHSDSLEPFPSLPWTYLDRRWLDQRLYALENDLAALDDSLRMSRAVDIFSADNFEEPFAGLIIVGEVDFCMPLLQAEPFPWEPRFPRECEIHEVTHSGLGYKRKYAGRFALRPPPTDANAGISIRGTES